MGAPGFAGYSLWGTISRDQNVLSSIILCCPVAMLSPCSSPVKMQHSTSTVQCSMARNESYCVMNGCFFFLFLSLLSHLVSCLSICGCGFIPAANILSEMQQHRYRTVLSFGMAMYSRATLRVATDKDLPAERETYPLSSRMSHYSKNLQWL